MQERIWLELKLPLAAISSQAFEHMAASLKAAGTAEEEDADGGHGWRTAWFQAGGDMQALRARITAAALLAGVQPAEVRLNQIDEDWQTAWQRHWQAMPVGRRLWVRPSFREPPSDDRIDIVLDPGMAFGTGTHATTQLCLAAIERICQEDMPRSMLDMGTGSGILAITAAKLGVVRVLAVDNDATAIEACRTNAGINHVSIECMLGDIPPQQPFDLVAANILAKPLIDMAPELAACTGKYLILSGLLITQAEGVSLAYEQNFLKVVHVEHQNEWAAIIMARPTKASSSAQ